MASIPPGCSISHSVAVGAFIFASIVAVGTYVRSREIVPAIVILSCSALFLGLWHVTHRRMVRSRDEFPLAIGSESRPVNWQCCLALPLAAFAWGCVIGGEFVPIESPCVALWHLALTGGACLTAFMLAIVGISDVSRPRGKRLGLSAVAATVGLVLVVMGRLLLGI